MPTKYITKIFIIACSFLFAQPAFAYRELPISESEKFRSYTDCKLAIEIANGAADLFVELSTLINQNESSTEPNKKLELNKKLDEVEFFERIEKYEKSYPDLSRNKETHPIARRYGVEEIKSQINLVLFSRIRVVWYQDDPDEEKKRKMVEKTRERISRLQTAYSMIEKKCNYKFK